MDMRFKNPLKVESLRSREGLCVKNEGRWGQAPLPSFRCEHTRMHNGYPLMNWNPEGRACLGDVEFHVSCTDVLCLWELQAMSCRQLKCWDSSNNGTAERLGGGTVGNCGGFRGHSDASSAKDQQPDCPDCRTISRRTRRGSGRKEPRGGRGHGTGWEDLAAADWGG